MFWGREKSLVVSIAGVETGLLLVILVRMLSSESY